MSMTTAERLFGYGHAFDHPVMVGVALGVSGCLLVAPVAIQLLGRLGPVATTTRVELMRRYWSWVVLAALMLTPVLLGAAWLIGGVLVLSILCYREFARATGLFRNRLISLFVVLGIFAVTFSAVDHWYDLFVALPPLTISIMAAVALLGDRPKGYIQRVALGAFSFLVFGVCLGHLGLMANDADYRPIVAMILVAVELNDVFAFLAGRTFGRRLLVPNTSPTKTVEGAIGALVLTTPLVMLLGHYTFRGGVLDHVGHLVGVGLLVSIGGQLGDLWLSSIKRALGIKDMGLVLPGHGGMLDRFDSILLVAPAVYHYVGYFRGFGLDQSTRIISGG